MQTHDIKRKFKNKKRMTVARGGRRGKTAGRGTKGQKARAGHKIRPEIRDVIKRIPKMRGRGKNSNLSIHLKPIALDIEKLAIFSNGDIVTREKLIEKGIIALRSGKVPEVKILGTGELSRKIIIKGIPVSKSVRAQVEKAGGAVS